MVNETMKYNVLVEVVVEAARPLVKEELDEIAMAAAQSVTVRLGRKGEAKFWGALIKYYDAEKANGG